MAALIILILMGCSGAVASYIANTWFHKDREDQGSKTRKRVLRLFFKSPTYLLVAFLAFALWFDGGSTDPTAKPALFIAFLWAFVIKAIADQVAKRHRLDELADPDYPLLLPRASHGEPVPVATRHTRTVDVQVKIIQEKMAKRKP